MDLKNTTTKGAYGNMLNNVSLAPGASSLTVDCSTFGDTVISYSDTNPTHTGFINIYGSVTPVGSNWVYLGKLVPIANAAATKREAVAVVKLSTFSKVYAVNDSTSETHTGCIMSALSN
jgi:hypothetical protein